MSFTVSFTPRRDARGVATVLEGPMDGQRESDEMGRRGDGRPGIKNKEIG